jgi:hypothetical protein
MTVVLSYTLKDQIETLSMPKKSKVLAVGTLFGKVVIWAEGDPDAVKERRVFGVWNSGREIHVAAHQYLGTAVIKNVAWHVFELAH